MRAPPSPGERGEREPRARRPRPLREDVPARRLERLERGEAAAREQADRTADASADARLQDLTPLQEPACTLGFEPQQPRQRLVRPVELGHAEAAALLRWQVDATQLEV